MSDLDEIPVMDVPGFGRRPVMQVFGPNEQLPLGPARYLVTKDGSAYRVPFDIRDLGPSRIDVLHFAIDTALMKLDDYLKVDGAHRQDFRLIAAVRALRDVRE